METIRISPPAELLSCPDAPAEPAAGADDALPQSAVADYLTALHRAHADCRDRLGAVRAWVEEGWTSWGAAGEN